MDSRESQEKEDGLRLRKNVQEKEVEHIEEDVKTDLVKRMTDCMPTDLPSAKRMVIEFYYCFVYISS